MESQKRIWQALCGISIFLLAILLLPLFANASEIVEQVSLPQKAGMKLVGFFALTMSNRNVGSMAVYDDPATKRIGDYSEFYNPEGNLLAIVWFDTFGILRSMVDRGVLSNTPLQGVFVLVLDGEAT